MLLRLTACCLAAIAGVAAQQTGNHPEWDRWCGKVYKPGYPAFDPGGQTLPPNPVSGAPLLDVQFKPRYSLYLDSEKTGDFVINAPLSQFFGTQWTGSSKTGCQKSLIFTIKTDSSAVPLLVGRLAVNTTGNVFRFNLAGLNASLDAIPLTFTGSPAGSNETYVATSELFYLPEKTNGSVTKLDNLNGGMLFRNKDTSNTFVPLLPYGFYSSFDGFLRNVSEGDITPLQKYAGFGLNAMTPLTNYDEGPTVFPNLDKMGIKWMFDMREYIKNLTRVEEQVIRARDGEYIFAYWSSDEPDGWQDPFNVTTLSHTLIQHLDPYHPVAVVLNCQDYYFGPYTLGADVIMEDAYPIGINTTLSKWGTPCSPSLGDCGCDNCDAALGPLNVAARLDDLARHEAWLHRWPKTKIHNPQSFHGEGYWARDPAPREEWVMSLLAFNHGAQGIISWVYPATDVLGEAHGRLARVVAVEPVVGFLAGGGRPTRASVGGADEAVVDAAYWVVANEMLVSVANGGYVDVNQTVEVSVPRAKTIVSVPWGNATWTLADGKLSVARWPGLATSLVLLSLE